MMSKTRRWPKALSRIVLIVITALTAFPFLWLFVLSFKTDTEILNSPFSLPESISFSNYERALHTLPLIKMFGNTLFVAVFALAISLVCTFMLSYAITRLQFKSKRLQNGLYLLFVAGLTIPPYIVIFPTYRMIVSMGLLGNRASLILPLAATTMALGVLLMVGFLRDFPKEIEEAAIIDGCNIYQMCTRVVLPVIKPVLATVIIFNVLYFWNEYPISSVLVNDPKMMTISLGASMFRGRYSMDYSGMIAATVIIIIPQLLFYLLFQKHIVEGMTAGAVKG
ncbi:carbohydrate ABC transporter permease [Eubacterium sp. am_0171]|uniref:Inner membrane ABC transporter permease protein ycjP n=1 Tax=Faecalicatena contorta TaxID=39482 RepID=A0A174F8D0_9FIRM|nr:MULTISPECIES: carbohydrate ABC transporter permease [Clostridia]MDU7706339.1 carbohydrate ABC transporter permease [Clostridium sp.]MSC84287.1 ABC transporter permease subunit [Eubacterium sp. BIOML-A1]MSD08429.1 ABC transporter permease subunit [Eubacterium sp. BIOML-A2]RYT12363.1 carbohydrate ABC transporter permease [Eubacterium sp. am_0171]CUO46354.1 Inner membrane ABC transporter permease protein ycjP [[Eubacterium] contortum] [Faecalicatena contorta]